MGMFCPVHPPIHTFASLPVSNYGAALPWKWYLSFAMGSTVFATTRLRISQFSNQRWSSS